MKYSNKNYKTLIISRILSLSLESTSMHGYSEVYQELLDLTQEAKSNVNPIVYNGVETTIKAIDSIYEHHGIQEDKRDKYTFGEIRISRYLGRMLYFMYGTILEQLGYSYISKDIESGKPMRKRKSILKYAYKEEAYEKLLVESSAYIFKSLQYFNENHDIENELYGWYYHDAFCSMFSRKANLSQLTGSVYSEDFINDHELMYILVNYTDKLIKSSDTKMVIRYNAIQIVQWFRRFM